VWKLSQNAHHHPNCIALIVVVHIENALPWICVISTMQIIGGKMIDLKKIEESVWVNYADDERYLIKFLSDPQLRTLANRGDVSIETYVKSKKQEPEKVIETNDETADQFVVGILSALLSNEMAVKVAVQSVGGWEGINASGQPLECTEENRMMLFSRFDNRAMWIYRQARNEKNWHEDIEADSKNSKPSSATK
jgi:hypothetical protein